MESSILFVSLLLSQPFANPPAPEGVNPRRDERSVLDKDEPPLNKPPFARPPVPRPPFNVPSAPPNGGEPAPSGPPVPPLSGNDERPPVSGPLAPVRPSVPPRRLAEDILAEALRPPEGDDALPGRYVSLVDALQRVNRSRRVELVTAYWNLSAAVASYHIWRDELRGVSDLADAVRGGTGAVPAYLAAELASGVAHVRQAEIGAEQSRHRLAQLLRGGADKPLPSDAPHVGTYRTEFAKLFPNRAAPSQVEYIHRTLPARHEAIDARAAAVRAAEESLVAASKEQFVGPAPGGHALVERLAVHRRQRLAFISEVLSYNLRIVEYAAAVRGDSSDAASFVAMLIQPRPAPREARLDLKKPRPPDRFRSPVIAASGEEPVSRARSADDGRAGGNDSTSERSILRTEDAHHSRRPITDGVRRAGNEHSITNPSATPTRDSTSHSPFKNIGPNWRIVRKPPLHANENVPQPKLVPRRFPFEPPAGNAKPASPDATPIPTAPIPTAPIPTSPIPTAPVPTAPVPRERPASSAVAPAAGVYHALVSISPAERARRLAAFLHRDNGRAAGDGAAITLRRYLETSRRRDRRCSINAYWSACEHLARERVLQWKWEQVKSLSPAARDAHLRAVELAAHADLLHERVQALASRFNLTRLAGRRASWPWPRTSTSPAAVAPAATSGRGNAAAHLASMAARRYGALEDRALAVVRADAWRAAEFQDDRQGGRSHGDSLRAIERQCDETLRFLAALTRYNTSLAEVTLAQLPRQTPPGEIARRLTAR